MIQQQELKSAYAYAVLSNEVLGTTMSASGTKDQSPIALSEPISAGTSTTILVIGPEMNRPDIKFTGVVSGFNRRLWTRRGMGNPGRAWVCMYVVSGEAADERLEFSEVAAVSMTSLTYGVPDSLPGFSRGMFPVARSRLLLSSKKIEVIVSELRRWRPNVLINPGRLPSEDE